MSALLVPGHTLRHEGAAFAPNGTRRLASYEGRYGPGMCSCGEMSGNLTTDAARKRWHREHKADVLSQQGLDAAQKEHT